MELTTLNLAGTSSTCHTTGDAVVSVFFIFIVQMVIHAQCLLFQEDDGDEDFEPPSLDEEEEGEEAGIRRRSIQSRELNDLLQDAYKQVRA